MKELIEFIPKIYPQISVINSYQTINEGYEDTNVLIETNSGKYVVKIFGEFRSDKNILDYIKVITEANKLVIKTLELLLSSVGHLGEFEGKKFVISKFIEGDNFVKIQPTDKEIIIITDYLSRLNTLDFTIAGEYDSWGNRNIVDEFKKSKVSNNELLSDIEKIVKKIESIDMSNFKKGVIHGDLQKKHVLKNRTGLYLIDYGCMGYDYIVYEISILMAWFCLDKNNWDRKDEIFKLVVDKYQKRTKLSLEEVDSIKILISASYGAYYLKTTELIDNGDNSLETREWFDQAKDLYYQSLDWIN